MHLIRHSIYASLVTIMFTSCSTVEGWVESGEPETKIEGKRIAILSSMQKVKPHPSLASIDVTLPTALAPENWVQRGGNVHHQVAHVALDRSLTETNDQNALAGEGKDWINYLIASPVTDGKYVYVMDAGGAISAHDGQNIDRIVWDYHATLDDEATLVGGGLAYENGHVYASLASGNVIAVEASTGAEKWTRSLRTPLRSAPSIAGDTLFIVTVDSQLFALDAKNGEIIWRHRGISESANLMGAVMPAVHNGRVIVAYPSGEIYALAGEDGKVLWNDSLILPRRTHAMGSFTGVGGDPVISENIVFTVSHNGLLAANDITSGLRIWEQPIASNSTPWVAGDYLYIISTRGELICLNKRDGRIKWVSQLPQEEENTIMLGPYLVQNILMLFRSDGEVFYYAPQDGSLKGTETYHSGSLSAPAFVGGSFYYQTQDGTLHRRY